MKRSSVEQIGLRGIVTATEWNESGEVTRVSIHTRDEEEYELDSSGVGVQLLRLITREVVVWGQLGRTPDGKRILRPASYAVIAPTERRKVPA